jgi:hypothetical protein
MINIVGYEKTCHNVVNVYDDLTIVYFVHYPSETSYLVLPSMESLGLERSFSKNLNLQHDCI